MPIRVVVEVTALEVSLVDHTPEELLAASLTGLHLTYEVGIGTNGDFNNLELKLDSCQLDDEQPTTRCVLVCPLSELTESTGLNCRTMQIPPWMLP